MKDKQYKKIHGSITDDLIDSGLLVSDLSQEEYEAKKKSEKIDKILDIHIQKDIDKQKLIESLGGDTPIYQGDFTNMDMLMGRHKKLQIVRAYILADLTPEERYYAIHERLEVLINRTEKADNLRMKTNHKTYEEKHAKKMSQIDKAITRKLQYCYNQDDTFTHVMDSRTGEIINPLHISNKDMEIDLSEIETLRHVHLLFATFQNLLIPSRNIWRIRSREGMMAVLLYLAVVIASVLTLTHSIGGLLGVFANGNYGLDLLNTGELPYAFRNVVDKLMFHEYNTFEYSRFLFATVLYSSVSGLFLSTVFVVFHFIFYGHKFYSVEDHTYTLFRKYNHNNMIDDTKYIKDMEFPFQNMNMCFVDEEEWIRKCLQFREQVWNNSSKSTFREDIRYEDFQKLKNTRHIMCVRVNPEFY